MKTPERWMSLTDITQCNELFNLMLNDHLQLLSNNTPDMI